MTSQWAPWVSRPISFPARIDSPSHSQSCWIGFWTGRVRDLMTRRVKWKSLFTKVISQKQLCTPGEPKRLIISSRPLKMQGQGFDHIPTSLPVRPVEKADGSWRIAVDFHTLGYVVTPIAAAVSDVVSSLKKGNAVPATW